LYQLGEVFHFGINYLGIASKAGIVTWMRVAGSAWGCRSELGGILVLPAKGLRGPHMIIRACAHLHQDNAGGVDLPHQSGQYQLPYWLCLFYGQYMRMNMISEVVCAE
jgi:hypothetical protein